MTVNVASITSGPYTGNGTTTSFSYTFRVETKNDLIVYETDTAGNVTQLTVDTDYVVNNIGTDGGGTIDRVAGPLPTGYTWYIRSNYQDIQDVDFTSQGAFYPDIHERAIDRRTFISLQQADKIERAIRLPDSYSGNVTLQLPNPEPNKGIYWNSTGDGLVNGLTPQQIQTSEANAAASATAAAASETNAATSAANAAASEANAAASEANAAASEANAHTDLINFEARYLGALPSNPTVDNQGQPLIDGALYWNTIANEMRVYDVAASTWLSFLATSASSITNTPAGNIAATDVQAAINELDTEKAAIGHTHTGVYQPANTNLDTVATNGIGTSANQIVQLDTVGKVTASILSQETLAWVTPTFVNGWVDFGASHPCRYAKDSNGTVYIKGLVKNGSNTTITTIFTLPVGYRPTSVIVISAVTDNGVGRVNVESTGGVYFIGSDSHTGNATNWLSVFATFRAEQ